MTNLQGQRQTAVDLHGEQQQRIALRAQRATALTLTGCRQQTIFLSAARQQTMTLDGDGTGLVPSPFLYFVDGEGRYLVIGETYLGVHL